MQKELREKQAKFTKILALIVCGFIVICLGVGSPILYDRESMVYLLTATLAPIVLSIYTFVVLNWFMKRGMLKIEGKTRKQLKDSVYYPMHRVLRGYTLSIAFIYGLWFVATFVAFLFKNSSTLGTDLAYITMYAPIALFSREAFMIMLTTFSVYLALVLATPVILNHAEGMREQESVDGEVKE